MKFELIDSIDLLEHKADKWNDLWERSGSDNPQSRAQAVVAWVRHLAEPARFRAIVVTSGDGWYAALPVLLDRRGPVRTISLLRHETTPGGDIIWDRTSLNTEVAEQLIEALRSLNSSLLWFDDVPAEATEWRLLIETLQRQGLTTERQLRNGVGWVMTTESWEWYESHLSKNHRKNQRKSLARLERQGTVEFKDSLSLSAESCRDWWQTFLDIENDNWKGEAGSSLRQSPRNLKYYDSLFNTLLDCGHLEMLQLTVDGEPIAAEFGFHGKGTYHSSKVGYRSSFGDFSPGHLLMYLQIKHYHEQGHRLKLNSISPVSQAMSRWANVIERQYRVTAALTRMPGNALAKTINLAVRSIRKIKGTAHWAPPELPASTSATKLHPALQHLAQ